jgi:uncharacterized protein (TIGR02265 family)
VQEKVVYREGIVSTVDAVRGQLTPRILERLKTEAGWDEAVKRPTYAIATLDGVVRVLSEELFKGRAPDDAMFTLGVTAMKKYEGSTLGKALFPLVRLLGPMKFMKRMPALFRQTNNYAEVRVDVTGPSSYIMDHNEVGTIPHYFRGVMQAAGEILKLAGHTCELVEYDGHRAKYKLSWRE